MQGPKRKSPAILAVLLVVGGALMGVCCLGIGSYFFFLFANRIDPEKALVGKWKIDNGAAGDQAHTLPKSVEFKADGTFAGSDEGVVQSGTWKILDRTWYSMRVDLNSQKKSGPFFSWTYVTVTASFSGNEIMEIRENHDPRLYQRFKRQ